MIVDDLDQFDMKSFEVQVDLEVIRRVMWKLVMNSIQATTRGLISITISYKPATESQTEGSTMERLQVVIQDTGKGMEQKFVDGENS